MSKRIKSFSRQLHVLLFLLFFQTAFPQLVDPGLESIKIEDLLKTVNIFTSADFDGRLSGSEGYNKAANFSPERFKQLDMVPAGSDEFFQYFNVEYNKFDTPAVFNLIMNRKKIPYVLGKDFVLRGFTGSVDITLPVVFYGYGISRPDLDYDDYEKINVKDKIAENV